MGDVVEYYETFEKKKALAKKIVFKSCKTFKLKNERENELASKVKQLEEQIEKLNLQTQEYVEQVEQLENQLCQDKQKSCKNKEKIQKMIEFFSSHFAKLENLTNANCKNVQQKLKAYLDVDMINFQVQFDVEFNRLKAGEKFDNKIPADIRACIETGDLTKHATITRVLKMPYETDGKTVRGQVEVLVFRNTAKVSSANNIEIGQTEDKFIMLVPIKIGKTIKKAVEIKTQDAYLNEKVKLNVEEKALATDKVKLWVGETGKHITFTPYKEQNLYYSIEKKGKVNEFVLQDDFNVLGKLKLKN